MLTISFEELTRYPLQIVDAAQRGEFALIACDGGSLLPTIPPGKQVASQAVGLEVAVILYDLELISLGRVASIAGLSNSEMINELGRHQIAVMHYGPGEFAKELDNLRRFDDDR